MRSYRKATIRDVAVRAGVSVTTVSLLMQGKRAVCAPETAQRIQDAIAALNYVPAPSLRALRTVETRTLGVCIGLPHEVVAMDETLGLLRNTFAEQIWRGLLAVADQEQYSLLHFPAAVRDSRRHEPFLDGRIDGLLLHPGCQDPRLSRLAAAGLPAVAIGRHQDVPPECGAVFTMEGDTADLALSHLWQLGHRRIAHIAGPVYAVSKVPEAAAVERVHYTPSDMARARQERYVRWLQVRGVYDPALVFGGSDWNISATQAQQLVAVWRQMEAPPTAVFCANDGIALAILAAAKVVGLRVPEQLSVLGVDDSPAAALLADPPLTSVRLPGEQVGREALGCLLDLMKQSQSQSTASGDTPPPCRIGVPVTRLLQRASTAFVPTPA